jgi:hypothetical protein
MLPTMEVLKPWGVIYRVNEEVDYSAAALAVTKTKNATKTKKRRAI